MNENNLENIMKNTNNLIIFKGTNEEGVQEVLLKACKDDDDEIYLYGFWSRDNCDIMNDDDLFDIVSRTLAERHEMDDNIKNITLFPNGIPMTEEN